MITQVIEELTAEYLRKYKLRSAFYINNGLCEEFAFDVCDRVPDADAFWGDELDGTANEPFDSIYHDHKVIEYNRRYYDAECPQGVDDWRDIPCFKRKREAA